MCHKAYAYQRSLNKHVREKHQGKTDEEEEDSDYNDEDERHDDERHNHDEPDDEGTAGGNIVQVA